MAQDERTLNMDLPDAVATAAREGNAEAVREWLAAGGAPDAIRQNGRLPLLNHACMSSRPSCASIVEILCAAGARDVGGRRLGEGSCLGFAAFHGALDTVRVLLRYGAPVNAVTLNGTTALHQSVMVYDWNHYRDSYSIANAQAATSLGHQGMVRMLLKHGAAVNACTPKKNMTPLILAAKLSGFVSLGVVRELLAGGADLNIVSTKGRNAEALARRKLSNEIYTGEGIPENPRLCRRPGAVEAFLELCAGVRAAGSWKRYVNKPRIDVIVLQRLCAAGRASPPPALARLFPTSTKSPPLPKELVWLILKFWRTDRDP
jgi:hypothetical protein